MAKILHTEHAKTVTFVRDEIVCSGCGAKSGMTGVKAVAKWQGRDWYCKTCGFKHSKNVKRPLCECEHHKYQHSSHGGYCHICARMVQIWTKRKDLGYLLPQVPPTPCLKYRPKPVPVV